METNNFAENIVSKRTIKAKLGVLDTSALIRAELNEICCFATQLFTVQGIYKEVKDKKTKRKLQFLPNFITIREPSEESFKFVCDFAKLAGCYNALSLTDLQVLALTHQLHVEALGPDSINQTPMKKVEFRDKRPALSDADKISVSKEDKKIPGFYDPSSVPTVSEDCLNEKEKEVEKKLVEKFSNVTFESDSEDTDADWDDDSWLTLENIEEARKVAARLHFDEDGEEKSNLDEVVCITLDYAMQGVLSQMGIPILSVDGVKTSKLKSFVLRCHSCWNKTPDISRRFCPSCGNKTMKKLFYSIGDDGEMIYHFSKYFVSNTRGLKYTFTPQGGKHGKNPWVVEDQRFPLNQACKKSKIKNLPLDPDYVAKGEPFTTRDVCSRYFNAGIHGGRKWKNPNERRPNTGNRNKKS